MADEEKKEEPKLTVTFSNGALKKLNELAGFYGLTPIEVVVKGMRIMDIAKDNKITKEDGDGKRYAIDVKEL